MESVAKEDREKALRALASWCIFQLEGREPNKDTLEDLGFGSTEAIRKQFANWDIPGWVIQGNYAPERPKPSETTQPPRKPRTLGPVKELPPADDAAPLFRERLEALIRETDWLKYRKEKLQGRHFLASSVREAPVYFSDEALSGYRRELGLGDVTEAFMHFGGARINIEGGTLAPQPPLPELIAAYLLAGGQLEPLVEALHPDPESAEWDKMRKHLEGRKSDKRYGKDGLKALAQQLATLIRGSTLDDSRPPSESSPFEVNVGARISDAKRLNPNATNRELYEDFLHRLGFSEEELSWGEFRRLANLGQEWPHT